MFAELSPDQARQYIDATAVFTALEQAQRGAMFWREVKGVEYLIRSTPRVVGELVNSYLPHL